VICCHRRCSVMPGPYSLDLRDRVVHAYLSGEGTYREISIRFEVGEATVDRWVARQRRNGSVDPDPMGGNRIGKFDEASERRLVEMVAADPGATLPELVKELRKELGLEVSPAAVSRALIRCHITRKKRPSMRRNETPNA
jgi:putative transposase